MRFLTSTAVALLLLVPLPWAASIHEDEARGFRITVPDGWHKSEREDPTYGHILTLLPPGSGGEVGVTVIVKDTEGLNSDEYLAKLNKILEGRSGKDGDIRDLTRTKTQLSRQPATGLDFRLPRAGDVYRLSQIVCIQDGLAFTVQCHALSDDFEAELEELKTVAESFRFRSRDREAAKKLELESSLDQLAARCGKEVNWADDWTAASDRARKTDRPVLIVAYFLQAFALSSTPLTTSFMDEDVIALANSRFVPLWITDRSALELTRADGSTYGMGPNTFGQALLVVNADGLVLAETNIASQPRVVHLFLRKVLSQIDSNWAPPVGGNELSRAKLLIDGGNLESGLELLENRAGLDCALERARALRLLGQVPLALTELNAALEQAPADDERVLAARLTRAEMLLDRGQAKAAQREAQQVFDRAVESDLDLAPQALYEAGILAIYVGDGDLGEMQLERLVEDYPESRWAWSGAVLLGSPMLELDLTPDTGPPVEDCLEEVLHFFDPVETPVSETKQAATEALEWLLDAQRDDGSFPTPSGVSYPSALGANPFADATTALAGRAFLSARASDLGRGKEAKLAAKRALEYVIRSVEGRALTPPRVLYMDYMTWSSAVMLEFLADADQAQLLPREELAPIAKLLVSDLKDRQQENGGWSYYKKNDLSADEVPAQSISFTTAGVSLALSHAARVGFDVPISMAKRATQALQEFRDEDGVFSYFLYGSGVQPHRKIANPLGDVGRGPACELALFRAGASNPTRLAEAIELFLRHANLYSSQSGKALMHAGPQGQGCHYLSFIYTYAALAAAELSPDSRRRVRILELVLDGRQSDGSFLNTPILGHAYGTAMALRALISLDRT